MHNQEFPKPIGLESNSSLQDGNKSENSHWERDVLNLKKDGAKILKNLFFRTTLLTRFNNWEYPQIPKMRLFKRGIRPDTPSHPTQRRRKDVVKKVLFLVSKTP